MKYILILGDGMSDLPIQKLGGKTPLMVAQKPHIDKICSLGKTGLFQTIPEGMSPGSEIANMAVLGYDVKNVFEGRGVLEAASIGVDLQPGDLALRCNILTIEDKKIKNHSAGHISNEEAFVLLNYLQEKLGNERVKFYPGVSYRHLLVIKNGNKNIKCTPPHDVPGTPFLQVMPRAIETAANETKTILEELILHSQTLLENHPVNVARKSVGKAPANSIWPWSPGYRPKMKTLKEMYGVETSAVISAVDLLFGIGYYAGMKAIKVEGATGIYTTNYEGKAKAAVDALKEGADFVYVHVEATDEAGHEGDVELKIKTIEYLDQRLVKYIFEETQKMSEPVCIAILPDHPTPCELKTHTSDPVPFIIYHPNADPDAVTTYNEESVKKGECGIVNNDEFIRAFLKK